MKLRSVIGASAVAVAVILAVSGCGIPTDGSARVEADEDLPPALLAPGPTDTIGRYDVTVCLVGEGGRLLEVVRRVDDRPSISTALSSLTGFLSDDEVRVGLSTALAPQTKVRATADGGVATVELPADFTGSTAPEQLTAAAQVVCTLTALPGIGQIRFEIEGSTVEIPRGDGSTTSDPLSRQDYGDLMPTDPP